MRTAALSFNMWKVVVATMALLFFSSKIYSQADSAKADTKAAIAFYGQASYYADKFNGRRSASGEIFSQQKYTAACNVLPLRTMIKVTNLSNGNVVIVKTNDRLHPKMRRLVDLSRIAAQELGFIRGGVTRVRIEVIP